MLWYTRQFVNYLFPLSITVTITEIILRTETEIERKSNIPKRKLE